MRHASYYLLGIGIATTLFLSILWVPTLPFIIALISGVSSLSQALVLSTHILRLAFTDSDILLTTFYLSVSVLTAANITLLVYYFKTYRAVPPSGNLTAGGLAALVAALGFGCASCGTFFVSVLATSLGGAGLVILSPTGTHVLQAVGLALLVASLYWIVQKVRGPLVCPVEK